VSSTTTFIHVKFDDEAPESQTETAEAGQTYMEGHAALQLPDTYVATVTVDEHEVTLFVHGDSQATRLAAVLRQASVQLLEKVNL